MITLHQMRTHPVPVEGCFGCKVAEINFNGCFPSRSKGSGRGDATLQRKWDKELDRYEDVRKQGIQPAGTTMDKILDAERKSDATGEAYDASDPYKNVKIEGLA